MDENEPSNVPPLIWCGDVDIAARVHQIQSCPVLQKLRVKIGFFLDSPFPTVAAFSHDSLKSVLPLVNELLKNDGLAFRTRESAMNFIIFCKELLNLEASKSEMFVKKGKKYTRLCSLPLSLPFCRYQNVLRSYLPMMELPPFETSILLRIDVLTPNCSLGMQRRLKSFRDSIEYEPSLRGMVVLLQIFLLEGDGSISLSGDLATEKEKIDSISNDLNDKYADSPWKPVVVMYGMNSQPELEPFFEDIRYISSYGIDQFSEEKEFLLFETDNDPRRLVFVPYFGCNNQMREANLANTQIRELRDVLMDRLYSTDDEKIEQLRSVVVNPVPFMKEYIMKQMLFIVDAIVTDELMDSHPTTVEYLDRVLKPIVKPCQHITLILDYNGTLLESSKGQLHETQMNPKLKEVIARISKSSKITIMIIGVIREEELAVKVGIPNLTYIGNHGFQIMFKNGSTWNMQVNRDLMNQRIEMANDIHRKACKHGAFIVDNGLTVVFNSKAAPPPVQQSLALRAWEIAEEYGCQAGRWRGGLLIRPKEVTKGLGVERALEEYFGSQWPLSTEILYVGDQPSDEEAVKYLQIKADVYFIRIMKGYHPKTIADAKLVRSSCVSTFLEWIANCREVNSKQKAIAYLQGRGVLVRICKNGHSVNLQLNGENKIDGFVGNPAARVESL